MVDTDANPANKLARPDAASAMSLVVEAEELGRRLDRHGTLSRINLDFEAVIAVLHEHGATGVRMVREIVRS